MLKKIKTPTCLFFFYLNLILYIPIFSWAEESAYDSLMKKYEHTITSADKTDKEVKPMLDQKKQQPVQVIKKTENKKKIKKNKRIISNTESVESINNTQSSVSPSTASLDKKSSDETEDSNLFGDWYGVKTNLNNLGFTLDVGYKADYFNILSGPESKSSGLLGNIDISLNIDLSKLTQIDGLDFFLYGLGNHGAHPSEKLGDSFGSTNIEAPETFKLYEAYLKKKFDNRFTILLGLRDLNADFYALDTSGYFINSSFGISHTLSQTGLNGPSIFPVTAPAVTAKFQSENGFYFQAGYFNATAGNPDNPKGTHIPLNMNNGNLSITELGSTNEEAFLKKVSFGFWQYSKSVETIDSSSSTSSSENYGHYFMIDTRIYNDISLFSKFGFACPKVNTFSKSIEAGLAYENPFNFRKQDALFFGYTSAEASDDYVRINETKKYESVFELGYKIKVVNGFWLTPNFQKVFNPGLSQETTQANIFILRINLIF